LLSRKTHSTLERGRVAVQAASLGGSEIREEDAFFARHVAGAGGVFWWSDE
jgi:hypothetical protein